MHDAHSKKNIECHPRNQFSLPLKARKHRLCSEKKTAPEKVTIAGTSPLPSPLPEDSHFSVPFYFCYRKKRKGTSAFKPLWQLTQKERTIRRHRRVKGLRNGVKS